MAGDKVDFHYEKDFTDKGYESIAGLDEVGRGALFGPVVSAAVMLPSAHFNQQPMGWVNEINDSKLLAPKKRKRLAREILANASAIGIGISKSDEVDRKNVYWASLEAMKRAVENMPVKPDLLLVDGFYLKNVRYPQFRIVQGDRKSISIAAASIIAKVFRDNMMEQMEKIFEGYSLSKNKGYGTREHFQALQKMGPTAFHRRTFNLGVNKK